MRLTVCLVGLVLAITAPASNADAIDNALANPARPQADLERDTRSKPGEVLRFFGLAPGMSVADVFAGGGYYSEIIAQAVGPSGKVILYNNAAYEGFASQQLQQRFAAERYPNIQRLTAEIGEIGIADASVDMVIMIMAYHDVYWSTDNWSIDPVSFFGEIRAMLKPGGVLGIVDHAAVGASGSSAAQTLHRIDEQFARSDIESRGFEFTGSLNVLRSPTDDHTKSVFDEEIRGKTDRFVYRFVKK
jgi:predicted methyltransferase